MMRRTGRLVALALALLVPGLLRANWTATGAFRYTDREWAESGFTGLEPTLPVRFADVEVTDPTKSGSKGLLARGKTDASGAFSIAVTDSVTRTVRVRVLTQTTQTPDLFVKVVSVLSGSVYAVASADVANHGPNISVNFGTLVAAMGGGGEALNLFDQAVYGADYVKFLTGSRPDSRKLLTVRWAINGGVTGASTTAGNTVTMRDYAAYDDAVFLHEWSHYVMNNYSKSSNPTGTHALAECNQDIRLAFDEGRASYFGCSVRRHYGLPSSSVYLRTSGAAGAGHVRNWYDLETETQYACPGAASEVTVSRHLWDIGDSAATSDTSPGVEDAQDRMALSDAEVWQVFTGPVRSAATVVHETFWDGWFDPTVANGYLPEMQDVTLALGIEFRPDAFEPNDVIADARTLTVNAAPVHLTYFADPDGNGKGQADTDLFRLNAVGGASYTVETLNLVSDANTSLELLDTNGSTVLASNNDRATGDPSSKIVWTAPRTDVFYVRSRHAADYGIYGSYDLLVTGP